VITPIAPLHFNRLTGTKAIDAGSGWDQQCIFGAVILEFDALIPLQCFGRR